MRAYGLVLAGGGAKGAYEMGAWKALEEIGIEIEAIAGTSIGAINGAMIAQGNFDTAMRLWSNAEVTKGIAISEELKETENLFSFSNFPQIFHEIIKNGGVDISPAKKLVEECINESIVRQSKIPFGIVTFQLNSMKPIEMFIEDMPEGQLIDYIMASARFPGLVKQGPDDSQYLDGGVYDNAPIGMLRKRGINRLIVIDISNRKGIGHKEEWSCADVIYIRPYDIKELGESFEFDKDMNEKRMNMGYLDTKKAFGYLGGFQYYFSQKEFKAMLKTYGYEACAQLEGLAKELGIERLKVYTRKEFISLVKKADIERENDNENVADVIKNRMPQILQERTERLAKKFISSKKLRTTYPKAYEVLDTIKK